MLRPWLELARISNLPTVWTNVTAGWLLAGGPWLDARLGWLLLAGSLLYTGGMILNDAADVKFDSEHRKERPIPSGRVSVAAAWSVGIGMLVVGWCVAVFVGQACWGITSALVAAILFYDLYHKSWSGAVWVMGACRVLLVLMAASSCPSLESCLTSFSILPSALALGAYIVGLTIVARMEAKGAVTSAWRAVFAKTLIFAPAIVATICAITRSNWKLISILSDLSPLAPFALILIFVGMVVHATRVMRQGGPAIGNAVGILLAGIAVVDALAVSQVSLPLAFGFVVLAPLLRLWQRWIAAT